METRFSVDNLFSRIPLLKAGARGVRIVALSISSHVQTQ